MPFMFEDGPPSEGWTLSEAVAVLFNKQFTKARNGDLGSMWYMCRALRERLLQGEFVVRAIPSGEPFKPAAIVPASTWAAAWPELGSPSVLPDWESDVPRPIQSSVPADTVTLQDGTRLLGVRVFASQPELPRAPRAELVRAFVHGYAAAVIHRTGAAVKRDDQDMKAAAKATVIGATDDEIRAAYAGLPRDLRNARAEERSRESSAAKR